MVIASDRSGLLGVVVRVNQANAEALDVLWMQDGKTTAVPFALLSVHDATEALNSPTVSPSVTTNNSSSVFAREKSFYQRNASSGYKALLPSKLPKGLVCPLDSIDPTTIETFQLRMDNFLCSVSPRIRELLTGDFEPPLLTFGPYLDFMAAECSPEDFVFDHAQTSEHIKLMREREKFDLAEQCAAVLDNPPTYDGFRPCNNAVFHAMVKSLREDDLYIMRQVTYGDGIGLRNAVWNAMTGDDSKSKKLMAMTYSSTIEDVKYRFQRHGVAKYFASIHKAFAKLKTLGAAKQD